jgi:hypothetical protein
MIIKYVVEIGSIHYIKVRNISKCDLFKIHAVHLYEILTLPTIR